MRSTAVTLVLAATLATLGCTRDSEGGDPPVRIMLLGDSVTQGSAGDLTWRYRLWDHLRGSGVDVDLVGPNDDVYDNVTNQLGSDEYLDPDFDRDHAARWGMAFATQDHPVAELVEEYEPDVLVEDLGFNDFATVTDRPAVVLDSARALVADARSADPGISIVLCELPQTWRPGIAAYNEGLAELAASLSTAESRVVATATGGGFVDGVDTWDPAHLTASGEVKLTAGVADALAGLGIGAPYPRPLPEVSNGPRVGADLTLTPGDGEVRLTWVSAPGVTSEYVWLRDATAGHDWQRLPFPVPTGSFISPGLVNGHTYEFRLQPMKGAVVAEDVFSSVESAVPVAA